MKARVILELGVADSVDLFSCDVAIERVSVEKYICPKTDGLNTEL